MQSLEMHKTIPCPKVLHDHSIFLVIDTLAEKLALAQHLFCQVLTFLIFKN